MNLELTPLDFDPLAELDGDDLSDMAALFAPHPCRCGALISFEASACFDCDPDQYESDRLFDLIA